MSLIGGQSFISSEYPLTLQKKAGTVRNMTDKLTDSNANPNAMAEMPAVTSDPFTQAVKPVVLTDAKDMFMFRCTCGNVHMRHAGYINLMFPFVGPNKVAKIEKHSHQVNVCTQCKKSYIWHDNKMYDVTALIDLQAWDKTEREMQHATGPGGNC